MPLNIDWQQILLHLLNFVLLFAILYFLLYKPVRKFMAKRAEYYESLDAQAKQALAEAEQSRDAYAEKLAAADAEIADRKKEAFAELEEASELHRHRTEEQAKKLIEDAHASIEADRTKMLQEARREITGLVAEAAEKLVTSDTTAQAYDRFLDTAERGESDV